MRGDTGGQQVDALDAELAILDAENERDAIERGERKVLTARIYTATSTSWSEWKSSFEECCEEMARRRGDVKPSTLPDEIIEVQVIRRARVHAEITVEVDDVRSSGRNRRAQMGRYLTDVTLTVEVECAFSEDIEATVMGEIETLPPLFVRHYEMGDFTVVEP